MSQFLKVYRDKPLIFAAKARVGTLPFEITCTSQASWYATCCCSSHSLDEARRYQIPKVSARSRICMQRLWWQSIRRSIV